MKTTLPRFLFAAGLSASALVCSVPAADAPAADAPNRAIPPITAQNQTLVDQALPSKARVQPKQPRLVLVTARTEGYFHTSISTGLYALAKLGSTTGAFQLEANHEMDAFTPENLKKYDAVIFLNTTQLKFANPAHRQALLDFVRSGKGLIGLHAASDNFPQWPEGQALMGGVFHSHPWVAKDLVAVKLDEPEHALNRAFNGQGFWIHEEIYQIVGPYSREKQRVLMSLDMSKGVNERPAKAIVRTDGDFPIGWLKREGSGRLFYSSLGHNDHIYYTPEILQHFLDGIQYALGDLAAEDIPSAKLSPAPKPALAPDQPTTLLDRKISARIQQPDMVEKLVHYDYAADANFLRQLRDGLRRSDAAGRTKFEKAVLDAAGKTPGISEAAQTEISELLSFVGTAESVPLLSKWATAGSDAAIRGLANISGDAAEKALIALLTAGDAKNRIAVVDALALRRSAAAVAPLGNLLNASDAALTEATLDALGRIGNAAALHTLESAKLPAEMENTRMRAVLRACLEAAATGEQDAAGRAATRLLSASTPTHRLSAAETLLKIRGASALSLTLPLLSVDAANIGAKLAPTWLKVAADAAAKNDAPAQRAIATDLATLPAERQLVLLGVTGQLANPALLPFIQAGLKSNVPQIRLAAFEALGPTATTIAEAEPLFLALRNETDRPVAVAALAKLRAPGTDDRLRTLFAAASAPEKAALLGLANSRVDLAARPLVLQSATSEDRDVRQAAFKALPALVRGDDLPTLLNLRTALRAGAERKAWNESLLNAIRYRTDVDAVAQLIGDQVASADAATRSTFAIALTNLNSKIADQVLRSLLSDPDLERRKETIRALSTARNARAADLLVAAAEKGSDESERILALRGYLDAVPQLYPEPAARVAIYRRAWNAAVRDEERLAILAALDTVRLDEARALATELRKSLPSAPPPIT